MPGTIEPFEPNNHTWYEVGNVAEIDGFDPDQYGNTWFNVKFVGNAETFMWLARNKPEEGKKYYGHLELTKSGKRLRFKTDKVPEEAQNAPYSPSTYTENPEKQDSIYRSVALNDAALVFQGMGEPTLVTDAADVFLSWLKGGMSGKLENPPEPATDNAPKPDPHKRDWDKLHKKEEEPDPEFYSLIEGGEDESE